MNFHTFVNQVAQVGGLETRISYVNQTYPQVVPHLPNGAINPPVIGENNLTRLEEDVRNQLSSQEEGYTQLVRLLAGRVPSPITEAYVTFARNKVHALNLLSSKREDRKQLKAKELFPFWESINQTVHRLFNTEYSDVPISQMKFTPLFIGKGGFGEVYRARFGKKEYALKIFHDPNVKFDSESEAANHIELVTMIEDNLISRKSLWNQAPFVPLTAVSPMTEHAPLMCIKPYVDGYDVQDMVDEGSPALKNKLLQASLLFHYGSMLAELHSRGLVFVDGGWTCVKTSDFGVNVFDYDFVMSEEDARYVGVHPARYRPQETYLGWSKTQGGDLESFAGMTHHLLLGNEFCQSKDDWEMESHAKSNFRIYPAAAASALPQNLGQIVPDLLRYPKNGKLTANDFLEAVKQDYGKELRQLNLI